VSRILLVDDEPAITESLAFAFGRAGFETEAASTLARATAALSNGTFDFIILDLMLPDGNGLDWLREFRGQSNLPVIILSSHDESVDQIVGLEVGADDYVSKPFSPREVVARVRAVLRRIEPRTTPVEEAQLRLEADRRKAWAGDVELGLSRTEFDLLNVFIRAPGRVYERGHLLSRVWGPDVAVTERTVDVHIKALRKKLVAAGLPASTIETVRGVGYRLSEAL